MLVPANVVKAAGEWHPSHATPGAGIWFVGGVLIVTPVKVMPDAWHFAHPLLMPVCDIGVPGPNLVVDA